MTNQSLRVLHLEDDDDDAELIHRELKKSDVAFIIKRTQTKEDFLSELEGFTPQLILADYNLPSFDGLKALALVQEKAPSIPFIFVSGKIGEEAAIEALKGGATDYVIKDRLSRLLPVVRRALEEVKERNERQLAEQQLRLTAQELARSNAELEKFAYLASHDLQEPLRSVASFLQLLEEHYQDKLDPAAAEYIQFAVNGARKMKKRITDLLEYSKVDVQKNPLQRIDSSRVLQTILAHLSGVLEENHARLTTGDLPMIHADPEELGRVFENLIENAMRFRSELKLEIDISAKKQEAAWLFAVRDNGMGIAEQYHDKIFGVFQRLQSGQGTAGTGIGLAICKKIIEHHGGHIWVESELQKGATFFFTIPERGGK